jgi:hypothetical protein
MYLISMVMTTNKWIALGVFVVVVLAAAFLFMRSRRSAA